MTATDATYTPNTRSPMSVPRTALMVVFQCPRCFHASSYDVYRGVPRCLGTLATPHAVADMVAERIDR